MKEKAYALLVYDQANPLRGLHLALDLQQIKTNHVRNREELLRALKRPHPPHVIFTDTTLPDGTWLDVLELAAGAPEAVNVIVVARWADVQFYVEAIERGAFDFVVPPFQAAEIEHIVRCAVDDVTARRERRAPSALRGRPFPVPRLERSALQETKDRSSR